LWWWWSGGRRRGQQGPNCSWNGHVCNTCRPPFPCLTPHLPAAACAFPQQRHQRRPRPQSCPSRPSCAPSATRSPATTGPAPTTPAGGGRAAARTRWVQWAGAPCAGRRRTRTTYSSKTPAPVPTRSANAIRHSTLPTNPRTPPTNQPAHARVGIRTQTPPPCPRGRGPPSPAHPSAPPAQRQPLQINTALLHAFAAQVRERIYP